MSAMYEGLDDSDDMESDRVPIPMISGLKSCISKPKKVSDMTIPEIEERMLKMHDPNTHQNSNPKSIKQNLEEIV